MFDEVFSKDGYKKSVVKNALCSPVGKNRSAYDLIECLNARINEFEVAVGEISLDRFASKSLEDPWYNIRSKNHRDIVPKRAKSRTQVEKNIARVMCEKSRDEGWSFGVIGRALNFEIPLEISSKDVRNGPGLETLNKGLGKIDLVSYNGSSSEKKLYLLELKRPDSEESLMRCVLEVFTYAMQVKKLDKFMWDFGVPSSTTLVLAPLFFAGEASAPYVDWMALREHGPFRKLIRHLEGIVAKHAGKKVKNVRFEFVCLDDTAIMRDIRKKAFDGTVLQ